MNNVTLPRFAAASLDQHLRVMPAVVLTGARQVGKSTLAGHPSLRSRSCISLDDLDVLDTARRDPEALLGGEGLFVIDEIQREPALLSAIKRAIDTDRRPGRFLLTGSANLLLMRRVSESLAGRASHLTLWPMTRREVSGEGRVGAWESLLTTPEADWIDVLTSGPERNEDWRAVARRGGFPTPALELHGERARNIWFDGYVRTYLERDLQDLSSISSLPEFRRLMRAACLRVGQLMNHAELARDVSLPQATATRWLNLLETSYMLVRLPAFATNRTKRLIKAPKCYWGDVGLALHLSGSDEPGGAHLENLVLTDLLAWRDGRTERAELSYWRTASGQEVDFVIEAPRQLVPIEVKSTRHPRLSDCQHLRSFAAEHGGRVRAGILIHAGDTCAWLAPNLIAVPWWRVL